MALARGDLRQTISGYATLVRVPNLFTAPPDVLLGVALAVAAGASVLPVVIAATAVASMLFYAGGTALNDYFDADRDAIERPERPIPSGCVPRRLALDLGLLFLVGGVAVIAIAAPAATVVSLSLGVTILLYDGLLKGGSAGFLAMGVTRGLNVTLGIAAVASLTDIPVWVFTGPAIVTGYITAITYMAAEEASGADRRAVSVGIVGMIGAALAVLIVHGIAELDPVQFVVGLLVTIAFVGWTGQSLRRAYVHPAPDTVGPAVGTCVLALVALDAAFAAVATAGWTAVILAFLVPAVGLARAFDVS